MRSLERSIVASCVQAVFIERKKRKAFCVPQFFFHELRKKEAEEEAVEEETKYDASKAKTSHVSDDTYPSTFRITFSTIIFNYFFLLGFL